MSNGREHLYFLSVFLLFFTLCFFFTLKKAIVMFTTVSVSCFVNPPCHRTRPISAAPEPPTYGPSANTGNMPFREDGPNIEALTGSISKSPLSTYCGVYMLQSAWLFFFPWKIAW